MAQYFPFFTAPWEGIRSRHVSAGVKMKFHKIFLFLTACALCTRHGGGVFTINSHYHIQCDSRWCGKQCRTFKPFFMTVIRSPCLFAESIFNSSAFVYKDLSFNIKMFYYRLGCLVMWGPYVSYVCWYLVDTYYLNNILQKNKFQKFLNRWKKIRIIQKFLKKIGEIYSFKHNFISKKEICEILFDISRKIYLKYSIHCIS